MSNSTAPDLTTDLDSKPNQQNHNQIFDQHSLTNAIQHSLPPLPQTLPALPPTATSIDSDSPSPIASTSSATPAPHPAAHHKDKDKSHKKTRKSKVAEACRFCRRSHMSCDAGRPCGRCVKRDIAHLCRDEPGGIPAAPGSASGGAASPSKAGSGGARGTPGLGESVGMGALGLEGFGGGQGGIELGQAQEQAQHNMNGNGNGDLLGGQLLPPTSTASSIPPFAPAPPSTLPGFSSSPGFNANFNMAMLDLASGQDGLGAGLGLDMTLDGGAEQGEFQGLGLSEFLQSLNDNNPFLANMGTAAPDPLGEPTTLTLDLGTANNAGADEGGAAFGRRTTMMSMGGPSVPGSPINKTERFLLTAADQKDGSRSDRLARVIHAKFEAGLLRPYNHVAGYTRLMRWMADNMSQSSRQRTLHTLSEFRPAFRAIASGLTDLDLVFIEEAFERLLLDYDRVFSSMGIPSCLWRRTGEIYKGNKEFAALVGVPIEHLQGGKLAIYELMAEESAVNYWEKYGNIAFDAGQKAVLTSCVLINQAALSRKRKKHGKERDKNKMREDAKINCCFSFTIRRDSYAIPSMIVGNFLKF